MTRDLYRVWLAVPVRWGDMDAYQHVNNAAYLAYCESARIHYFEGIGLLDLASPDAEGPVVASVTCNFFRQVRYPATLDVGVRTERLGRSSFVLEYGLFPEGEDQPVADGSSAVVWVDYAEGRSRPLPEVLAERIRELDNI